MTNARSISLKHSEARDRFDLLKLTSYDVRLDLRGESTFDSVTVIEFESQEGETFLDLKPEHLRRIVLDDRELDVETCRQGRVPLRLTRGAHRLLIEAEMPFRNDGEGLHRSVDPADGKHYVYGMSFMDAAPSIFACFDQPDLKAPYTFHVIAPSDWTVIGNAPGTQVESGTWEFEQTQPLSTYFVTLVAGPYHLVHDEHDGIPLSLSARAALAGELEAQATDILTVTKQSFDAMHRLFGIRYPFGNYHQAFVPEFNAGAMENPGCVTFRDPLIFTSRTTRGAAIQRANTITHEMAHQWFGDIVTPKWWDDLWLNESFAEYVGNRVAAEATEYSDAWTHAAYARREWGLTADLGPNTHPIAGNGAEDALAALQNFDGISYAKGSTVLRQLATRVGDEVFFGGVIDHLTTHRFGNATMHDLFASWERAGAGELSGFIDTWLRTAGPDTFTLDRSSATLRRTPPAAAPAEREHAFSLSVHDDQWRTLPVRVAAAETAVAIGDHPVIIDPREESWGVYVPDAVTFAALPALLPDIDDDALLAGVWNNVRSGFHIGALDPAQVMECLIARPPVEDTDDGRRHVLPWALSWVLPMASPEAAGRFHEASHGRIAAAETGSTRQLQALRLSIATATDPALLRSWLNQLPEAFAPDLDLLWRILVRLATIGATEVDELDAALDDEPTAISRVEHTRARASLPTAEAKEFAWDRFTGAVDVANYEVEAAGLGLWRAGQEAVTASYVDRYLAEIPALAERRSGWVLGTATESFFPLSSVTPETVARAEQVAADPNLDGTIRRKLTDCNDTLARRLAIAQRYAVTA